MLCLVCLVSSGINLTLRLGGGRRRAITITYNVWGGSQGISDQQLKRELLMPGGGVFW